MAQQYNMYDLWTRLIRRNKNIDPLEEVPEEETVKRTAPLDLVWDAVWAAAYRSDTNMRVVDLFADSKGVFVLYRNGINFFRADIEFPEPSDGLEAEVVLGEIIPLELNLQRTKKEDEAEADDASLNSVTVRRTADGDFRVFIRAGTALLNKELEVDSTALFDNMIQRSQDLGLMPTIDFMHLGGENPMFEFGSVDTLARDGYVYLASGLLDSSHPLTPFVVRSLVKDPESWGASIEYLPLQGELWTPDNLEEDTVVRVMTDGINVRISLVPEVTAAHHFTSFKMGGVLRMAMTQTEKDSFLKLFGGDEDAMNSFLEPVTRLNQLVDSTDGVIARTATEGEEDEPVGDAETPTGEADEPAGEGDAPATAVEVTMTAELEDQLVTRTTERLTGLISQLTEPFEALQAQVAGMQESVNGLVAANQIAADLPAHLQDSGAQQLTFRARSARTTEPAGEATAPAVTEPTDDEIAANALNNMGLSQALAAAE